MGRADVWPTGAGAKRRELRLLFTSAGRRVELLQAFAKAARALRIRLIQHATDIEPYFAAACMVDHVHHVPPASASNYVDALLRLVRKHRIDMLVPLIDNELPQLAQARERFADAGCVVVVSSPAVVQTCRDKLAMFEFLTQHGIDTPRTWQARELLSRPEHDFPYFLKPQFGSASQGNFIIHDEESLRTFASRVPDAIVQEFVTGLEHTLDVYTGFDGRARCVVPRMRVEVRGGEVTKSLTVKHAGISRTGVRVVEALKNCMGLITIQLILTADGRMRVIEVNPRFGGGAPLSIQAGADFPKWLLAEWLGRPQRIRLDHFKPGTLMLRYHQSFFLTGVTAKQAVRSPGPT